MSGWTAKRFWTAASVAPEGEGFTVRLDNRPVKTPAKTPLIVPTQSMAEAIAAEWDAQEGKVDPLTMPVTRSANAALDKVTPQFAEVVGLIAEYGGSDLLCYRAETPAELLQRQSAAWDPVLDWAARELKAPLAVASGVMHIPQDPDVLARLHNRLAGLDPFRMAAMHDLVGLSGSLILGLAAAQDLHPIEHIWELSRIDETWQAELWGADDEATRSAELKKQDFLHAKRFLSLCEI